MNDTPARPSVPPMAREIVEGAVRHVADEVIGIVEYVAQERDSLKDSLQNARRELEEAARQLAAMTAERDARPSKDELDAAEQRVAELREEVERLQTELEARPQNPDQVLDLFREQMEPLFQRLRERAQG